MHFNARELKKLSQVSCHVHFKNHYNFIFCHTFVQTLLSYAIIGENTIHCKTKISRKMDFRKIINDRYDYKFIVRLKKHFCPHLPLNVSCSRVSELRKGKYLFNSCRSNKDASTTDASFVWL